MLGAWIFPLRPAGCLPAWASGAFLLKPLMTAAYAIDDAAEASKHFSTKVGPGKTVIFYVEGEADQQGRDVRGQQPLPVLSSTATRSAPAVSATSRSKGWSGPGCHLGPG